MGLQNQFSSQTPHPGNAVAVPSSLHVMNFYREVIMTKKAINEVQDFLTIVNDDGNRVYQIVNLELLLKRHPAEAVISFLRELQNDYGKQLSQLIREDKTNSEINEIVAKSFRIKMAINTIRNHGKEVNAA